MIPAVEIEGSRVNLIVELLSPIAPYRDAIEQELKAAAQQIPGVETVEVTFHTRVRPSGSGKTDADPIAGVRNTIAVASGKGGVGKSTVAANLAVALSKAGAKVGLLDADKALIWRGPLVAQLITQFLNDVLWEDLDYLVIDLPPGTGDVQLTLTQKIPLSGAVIVTTPQDVALADAVKGLKMFQEVKTPVVGIIENMSGFVCPCCGTVTPIFGEGGGRRTAEEHGVPFLGEVPIDPIIREGGDTGSPIVAAHPDSVTAKAFEHLAEAVAIQLARDAATKPRKPMIRLMQARQAS